MIFNRESRGTVQLAGMACDIIAAMSNVECNYTSPTKAITDCASQGRCEFDGIPRGTSANT